MRSKAALLGAGARRTRHTTFVALPCSRQSSCLATCHFTRHYPVPEPRKADPIALIWLVLSSTDARYSLQRATCKPDCLRRCTIRMPAACCYRVSFGGGQGQIRTRALLITSFRTRVHDAGQFTTGRQHSFAVDGPPLRSKDRETPNGCVGVGEARTKLTEALRVRAKQA